MPDAKRSRSAASRPGKAGESARARRATNSAKPASKPVKAAPGLGRNTATSQRTQLEDVVEPIKRSVTESVEQRLEQRLGFTARRVAVLAAVMCVLTLTIAGPVRTYFAQRTEMEQLAATEAALRTQIADLEQRKGKLNDPAYIATQARERLGFVMPGDTPFQVQLPATAAVSPQPGADAAKPAKSDPWYTSLWHTIADAPHLPPATVPPPGVPGPAGPAGPAGPPGQPGG